MATEILKKQTIVGTDAQYEANKNSYEEGTVFESTSLLGEGDIDPTYTNKFVSKVTTKAIVYGTDSTDGSQKTIAWDTAPSSNTIVRRDSGGHVRTADPVADNDAATKAYVDSKKTYTHYIHMQRGVYSDHNFMEVFMNISGSSISTYVYSLAELTALLDDVYPGPWWVSATGWDKENDSPIIGTVVNFGTGELCFMEKNGDSVTVTDDFVYDDNVK